jgi:subtilisin family serine protease
MVIVAAAGNENTQAPIYPGDVFGVIKVSAVGPDRTRASYSNYGGAIAIAAPGGDTDDGPEETSAILSTYGRNLDASGYRHLEGTSMAAPHVTGVAALLFAAGAAPGQIRDAIQSTAMPLNEPPNPAGGNQYGAGLIDAYAALRLFTQLNVDIVGPQDRGTTLLKNVTIQLTVRQAAQLSAPSDLTVEIRTGHSPVHRGADADRRPGFHRSPGGSDAAERAGDGDDPERRPA